MTPRDNPSLKAPGDPVRDRARFPIGEVRVRHWDGFRVEEFPPIAWESSEVFQTHCAVYLVLDGPFELHWRSNGERVDKIIQPGRISVLPANRFFAVRVRATGRSVVVSMEPRVLACAAADLGRFGDLETRWAHGVDDPLMRELVNALREPAAREDDPEPAYAASLASALAARVVRDYSTAPSSGPRPEGGGLAPRVLRRTIEYIHDRLDSTLTVAQLAECCSLSAFHFSRMFKRSTGLTPHQYLVNQRVARARQLLIDPALSLAEIALRAGFYDQAHLTRCFRRVTGTTPASFARRLSQPALFAAEPPGEI